MMLTHTCKEINKGESDGSFSPKKKEIQINRQNGNRPDE